MFEPDFLENPKGGYPLDVRYGLARSQTLQEWNPVRHLVLENSLAPVGELRLHVYRISTCLVQGLFKCSLAKQYAYQVARARREDRNVMMKTALTFVNLHDRP